MSKLAYCQVCKGKKRLEIFEPFADCKFCNGSGIYPSLRQVCTACSGKGVLSISNKNSRTCGNCNGSGTDPKRGAGFWCFTCHGSGLSAKALVQ